MVLLLPLSRLRLLMDDNNNGRGSCQSQNQALAVSKKVASTKLKESAHPWCWIEILIHSLHTLTFDRSMWSCCPQLLVTKPWRHYLRCRWCTPKWRKACGCRRGRHLRPESPPEGWRRVSETRARLVLFWSAPEQIDQSPNWLRSAIETTAIVPSRLIYTPHIASAERSPGSGKCRHLYAEGTWFPMSIQRLQSGASLENGRQPCTSVSPPSRCANPAF